MIQAINSANKKEEYVQRRSVENILFILAIAGALIGIKITVFLLGLQHYVFPVEPEKLVGGLLVISHWSSSVLGIPLALIGTVFYVLVLIFAGIWFHTRAQSIKKYFLVTAGIAAVIALGMAIWQPVVIGVTCKFCMQSHMVTGVIFVLSLGIYFFRGAEGAFAGVESIMSLRVLIWPILIFAMLAATFIGWWDAAPNGLFTTVYTTVRQ